MKKAEGNATPRTGIVAAFVDALSAMKNPGFDKSNSHFREYRYASLAAHVEAAKSTLTEHDLVLVQPVWTLPDGNLVIRTTVYHGASGESLPLGEFRFAPHATDPQKTIGSLTYFRRASLAAALGIVGEEDDDCEMVSSEVRDRQRASEPQKPKVSVAQAIGQQVAAKLRDQQRNDDPQPIREVLRQVAPPVKKPVPAVVRSNDGKICKVLKVSSKNGETRGKPWTRFAVLVEENGEQFWMSTFDEKIAEIARSLVGKSARIDAREGKMGLDLIGLSPAEEDASAPEEDDSTLEEDGGQEVDDDDIPF